MQMPDKIDMLPGTDKEYDLICRVKVVRHSYRELDDGRTHETQMVLLLPRLETTEASRMLVTYLPDVGTYCLDCYEDGLNIEHIKCPACGSERVKTEWTELPAWIAHPVHSPSRLALLRKNNTCSQHHLFVMGTGAEKDLLEFDGKEVHVKIFSSLEDNIVDQAKSVEKTAKY